MICVSICEKDFIQVKKTIKKTNALKIDLVEFRIDCFNFETRKKLKDLISLSNKPVLVTLRSKKEGGFYSGKNFSKILINAVESGAGFVDVEAILNESDREKIIRVAKENNVKVILSKHFKKVLTKKELDKELLVIKKISGVDFVKFVPTAKKIEDNIEVLSFLLEHQQENIVSFCMGEESFLSRILCLKAGGKIVFASVSEGKQTAKGQVSVQELVKQLDSKNFCVIGFPMRHSLSPLIHKTCFRDKKINANYFVLEVNKRELGQVVFVLKKLFNGFNVSMPLKEEIIRFLDFFDVSIEKIKAVNTVVVKNGELIGFNTDWFGAVEALKSRVRLNGKRVLLFGAGGAAKAICFGLKKFKTRTIIVNRTFSKSVELAEKFGFEAKKISELDSNIVFDIVINATSVGFKENKTIPVDSFLKPGVVVLDIVYNPVNTLLLKKSRVKKCVAISGVEMLLYQGVKAFELFTGEKIVKKTREKILLKLKKVSKK